MAKLTKKQSTARQEILAWLDGGVPLDTGYVLENYVPQDITLGGKHYTPLSIGNQLMHRVTPYLSKNAKVLEPCAGIGHLVSVMPNTWDIHAYELDLEASRLGDLMFGDWSKWFMKYNPFNDWDLIEDEYDATIMNPPFNTSLGMKNREYRSEYEFLLLAIHATKLDGIISVIGPGSYLNNLPKSLELAITTQLELLEEPMYLDGDFKHAGIGVCSYIFARRNAIFPIESTVEALKKFYGKPIEETAYEELPSPKEILADIRKSADGFYKIMAELENMLNE